MPRPKPLVAAASMTLASVVVGAYDVLTRKEPTSLAAVAGYVLGGLLVGSLWTCAGFYWLRARRAEPNREPNGGPK